MSALTEARHRRGQPSAIEPAGFFSSNHLTGPQKAAIIVKLLLADGASLPLTTLPEHLQAALTQEIGLMRSVDRETLEAVVEEFCSTIERIGLSFPGGLEAALAMLDGHISPNAVSRLKRLAGASTKTDPWDKIRAAEVERLLPLVAEESVEIAAVILSKIVVPRAAELLGLLPGDRARRIALAMSRTGAIDPETVRRIGLSLLGQLDTTTVSAFEGSPADRIGAILNSAPAATREDVLLALNEADQALAAQVSKTIFTFAHIPDRVWPRDVPKVLKGIDQEQLVKALGGARGDAATTAEFLLSNMSQRLAASIREEMDGLGKVKEKDVEAAQSAVVSAIRALEATGELSLIVPEEEEE
ncbi:MAG: FliG C-terminal domain-containing protein [Paracoccaceae bacterium]